MVVVVSRHSGDTGPLLSAHYTGNFGAAEYGGADRSVAPACPNAHHAVVDSLRSYAPEDYDVAMECTHHGPT
ncbi:D-tyrosyl-tRNA(Tyr) deacylase, partial [Halobacterium salinarum]|nr:D-tyrosyl-tRNA(Tyr) deacylase [Halobacterium salinarum]